MDQPTPAQPLSPIARMKLHAELTILARDKLALKNSASEPMAAFKVASIASKIVRNLTLLGIDLSAPRRTARAFELEGGPEPVEAERQVTAKFFDFDPNRKHSQRKKDNAAAMELLRQIDAGDLNPISLTDAQRETLARYSGTGGNLVGADGKAGSAYEYYTPKPIAAGMWDLLSELGFNGGKVLDPCAGVGIFGATAPANAAMETVELNATSGRINQLVNGGPGYNAIVSPFEAVASRTADEIYDAVISNVPFGGVHDRGSNRKIDEKYQDQPLETYFILRSLEKLKPGGLAAFIVPPRVVSAKGGREEQLRIAASYMAEFRGAYRLPNSVFGTADADTITDVIVFRKFGREALNKIAELKEQNPAVLVQANVQWTDFVGGRYFDTEGKRFVLGEFVAKDPNKFRDVDRVVSDQSVPNVVKLLRKFPDSRIDWKLLDATETEPISYADGDTMTLAGQTLEMRDGRWVALGRSAEDDSQDALGTVLTTATAAVTNKVSWEQARGYVSYLRERSMDMELPIWLREAHRDLQDLTPADQPRYWAALSAGIAAVEVSQQHSEEAGFNYLEEYPVVSEALAAGAATARKAPASFSRNGKAALKKIGIVYDRRSGFSAIWRGEVETDVMAGRVLDEDAQVEAIKYQTQGITLDVSALKGIYGDQFDPLADDDWCVSADGSKATKADDYYVGNYAEFLARIDGEIAQASGPLRDKLLRQKDMAAERVGRVDPSGLRFNLFSPFVDIEEKAEFLRRFMHPAFAVAFDDEGNKVIICDISSPKTEQERQFKRFAEYLKRGNLSTRSSKDESPELDEQRRKMLRGMVAQSSAQFDQWVKANPVIMERLRVTANDPARLYFNEVEDTSPLKIDSMAPSLALHGYQNAFVRSMGRSFGGINGFAVGLGKTFSALAAAQYVQSIGVKKKTLFVVPNSVLSNWRKEAGRAYTSMDDCLFVGLDINEKTGKASVDSGNYARDFTRILENRHRKIFCTLEAFKTIPLKDETVELYDSYLTGVDPSYADSEKKADSERSASKRAEATSGTGAKSSAIPFFEDMGIDSLVIDEAHMFKNSKQTVEFSGAKFLSVADASQRGLDIQIKAWFVRGLSPLHDGVLGLTATPITNSPLEIYSMLCLAVGEQKVHDLCMGARGADAFMDAMCVIVDDEEATIDGRVKPYRVFSGLQNVELLRTALSTVANIKNAEDVKDGGDDLKLPEAPENRAAVQLPQPVRQVLNEYKMAYRAARYEEGVAAKDAEPPTEEEYAALARVADKFGEPVSLIAHPFNLINKMTMLIADPELDERASFYSFAPVQADKARAAIQAFNKLGKIEARALAGPHTDADAVVGQKIVKDGDTEVVLIKIKVQAKIGADGRIVVDTMDTKLQEEFEKQADKAGLDLDVSVPPKLAALLENVRNEEANPRSASGRVKQLIFCDVLPLHNKIKRLLTRRAGFAASAIAIISGQAIKNPEQMQGIQDGFNAEGEDNKYRIVIANEKAEVGINLQKGTQAIHHLTIGWTPDSTIQRNGRGVRQGNTTARVNIYHYDAEGTFDEYKRTLTSKKADWIGAVMDRQGGNEVAVSGGLTNDQYDELIESMGDATAIQAIKARAELREKQARAESARARQVINIQTAQSQQKFVLKFGDAKHWIRDKALALYDLRLNLAGMRQRAGGNMNANALIRLETRIAEAQARVDGMVRDLNESAEFVRIEGYGPSSREVTLTLDQALTPRVYGRSPTAAKQREDVHNYLISGIRVKPDSTLVQDWQSEIDAAKRMVDEAVKDFERIAADSEGGYSADFIQAFKDDEIQIIDGKLFAKGMFVRDRKGALGVLQSKTVVVRFPAGRIAVADLLRAGAQFITPGTSEHDQALTEAAALDDAAEGVTETNKDMLFSAIVPEVAQRRKSATLIDFDAGYVTLPSPFFRYPVSPDAVGASEALVALARSQEGIIKSWTEGGKRIRVDAAADVQKVYPQPSSKLRALRDHAKAHGVRYTVRDFGILAGYGAGDGASLILGSLKELGDWPDNWFEQFTAAQDVDALGAVLRELVTAAFGAWLDIPQGLDTMSLMATQMVGAYNRRVAELRAAAAAALAAQNQSAEPEQIVVAGVTPNARGLIGIQGETRPNKEHIKAAAKAVGGYARWNGDAGRWDVPAQAWDYLVKNQPNIAKVLYPVPA